MGETPQAVDYVCPFEATDQPACKRYILHLNLIPGLEKIRPGDVFTPAFDVFRCMQDYLRINDLVEVHSDAWDIPYVEAVIFDRMRGNGPFITKPSNLDWHENDRSPNAEIENLLINPQPLYQHGRYAIPKRSEATKRRKREVREVKPLPFGALERVKRGDDADLS